VSSICVDARPVQVPDDLPWITLPLHAVRVSDDDGMWQCPISPEEVARWVDEVNRTMRSRGSASPSLPTPTDRVLATLTVGPTHGIHRLAINNESTGEVIDLHAARVGHDPPRDLGVHALHAGDNHLTVDAVALGPRASFAGFGLDYLLLERVP
jgi:hypothetical protein